MDYWPVQWFGMWSVVVAIATVWPSCLTLPCVCLEDMADGRTGTRGRGRMEGRGAGEEVSLCQPISHANTVYMLAVG